MFAGDFFFFCADLGKRAFSEQFAYFPATLLAGKGLQFAEAYR